MPRQFCEYGIRFEVLGVECDTIACILDCSRVGSYVYNEPADIATYACYSIANLNLILCFDI